MFYELAILGKLTRKEIGGSGRNTTAHGCSRTIEDILDAQGYKYKTGNDAPQGGILGNYIKVSKTGFNFIMGFKK